MNSSLPQSPYSFSAAELDAVEDDLVRIVEEVTWSRDTLKLRAFAVNKELKRRGHTHARISAAIDRLVKRGVIEVIRGLPVGHPSHARSEPIAYVTTFEGWASFLKDKEARKAKMTSKEQIATALNGDQKEFADADPFAEFTTKQRKLLNLLHGTSAVPIDKVRQVVYGSTAVTDGALTKLVIRTNQALSDRNYSWEISRKANVLSLRRI